VPTSLSDGSQMEFLRTTTCTIRAGTDCNMRYVALRILLILKSDRVFGIHRPAAAGAIFLHPSEAAHAVQSSQAHLDSCHSADVALAQVDRIDETGAVLLARVQDT